MYTLYGISNCDTVKKSKKKLNELGIEFNFVDFKKEAPDEKLLKRWKKAFGDWPLNKKGRTYRQLKDEVEALSDTKLPQFIAENTSLIKRPILEEGSKVLCFGFDEEVYSSLN